MDYYEVPFSRKITLECIVDTILPLPEITGSAEGLMQEEDVAMFSKRCNCPDGKWNAMSTSVAIQEALDFWRSNPMLRSSVENITKKEIRLMPKEFIDRLEKRLKVYSAGRRLLTKSFDDGAVVGFRWE